MKALVKARAERGSLAGGRPRAEDRHQRRADPRPPHRHLRHRPAHLQLGRVGRRRRSPCRWSSATSSWARSSRSGSNVADFHPGEIVSGEGHVVCGRCRNCLAGRRHLCADTQGHRRQPRRARSPSTSSLPMTNVWRPRAGHRPATWPRSSIPFGNAVHTALSFDVLGEDVLITGAGPIGIMARRGRAARRARATSSITDVNPYRLELAQKMGATRAVERPHETKLAGRAEGARHEGGLRRRPGDVRQPAGLPRHARQHGPRRQDRHARHPREGDGHRLEHRHLQHADDQGHLRPRDVRDLVQDDA